MIREATVPCRQEVIALRTANPQMTCTEISPLVGVSRQRVDQILREEGLPTVAIRPPMPSCRLCGNPVPKRVLTYCSTACRSADRRVELVCSCCGKVFSLCKGEYVARLRKRISSLWFCSNECQGRWLGLNYGNGSGRQLASVDLVCSTCGVHFSLSGSMYARRLAYKTTPQWFCSHSCGMKWQNQHSPLFGRGRTKVTK